MDVNFSALTIDNIRTYLTSRNETLAVAESVTAGFLQAAFSIAQDASLFYEGGLTAYNITQKVRHLGVNRNYAASCNCVSERTAREMAVGVIQLFESDWGLAITGYASPVKESEFSLFAWFAIARHNEVVISKKIELQNQDSTNAQMEYAHQILGELEALLTNR